MSSIRSWRASGLAALASIAILFTVAGPAAAAEPAFEVTFPAGVACDGFDLHIVGHGTGPRVDRDFSGRDGTVLNLVAGKGYALTFVNGTTKASVDFKANGTVQWTATHPDGSADMALMGHNVVILFPTDGGPSTTVYVGRVTIAVATDGVWTVGQVAGTSTDICAAIS